MKFMHFRRPFYREGLEWNFSVKKCEDQAVEHAAALAGVVAHTTKVLIIATSIQMCEKIGSEIQRHFRG